MKARTGAPALDWERQDWPFSACTRGTGLASHQDSRVANIQRRGSDFFWPKRMTNVRSVSFLGS